MNQTKKERILARQELGDIGQNGRRGTLIDVTTGDKQPCEHK